MEHKKLPVTIFTGFLGAGKTTVINQLLSQNKEAKIAVIENEFGDESIDSLLVAKEIDKELFDLSNGCICCNLSTDLIGVLKLLLSPDSQFTHLFIETTGIADPAGIIKPFLSDPVISQGFCVDAVICIADVLHIQSVLAENKEAVQQLSLADYVLLNKVDASDDDHLAAATKSVLAHASFADIYNCSHGSVPVQLLDTHKYSGRSVAQFSLNYTAIDQLNHTYTSFSLELNGSFDLLQFKAWIHSYCFFNQRTVLRVKGFVSVGKGEVFVVQAVRDSVSVQAYDTEDVLPFQNKLVFIGTKLNEAGIRSALEELVFV